MMNYSGRDFLLSLFSHEDRFNTTQEDNNWENNCFNPLVRATDGSWKGHGYQLPKEQSFEESYVDPHHQQNQNYQNQQGNYHGNNQMPHQNNSMYNPVLPEPNLVSNTDPFSSHSRQAPHFPSVAPQNNQYPSSYHPYNSYPQNVNRAPTGPLNTGGIPQPGIAPPSQLPGFNSHYQQLNRAFPTFDQQQPGLDLNARNIDAKRKRETSSPVQQNQINGILPPNIGASPVSLPLQGPMYQVPMYQGPNTGNSSYPSPMVPSSLPKLSPQGGTPPMYQMSPVSTIGTPNHGVPTPIPEYSNRFERSVWTGDSGSESESAVRSTSGEGMNFNSYGSGSNVRPEKSGKPKKSKVNNDELSPPLGGDGSEDKQNEKSKRSREASRRYRQRKKAVMEQMKKELESLMKEKAELEAEKEKQADTIGKLKSENQRLRKKQLDDANQIERERVMLVGELERITRMNPAEEDLRPVVEKIKPYCHRINQLASEILARFISADTVHQLVRSGYFQSDKCLVDDPSKPTSLMHVVLNIIIPLLEPVGLSEAQKKTMHAGLNRYYTRLVEIGDERRDINEEVLRVFEQPVNMNSIGKDGVKQVLKATAVLECLRSNLKKESDVCYDCLQDVIVNPLTPKQLGTFFLKIEFLHKSVQQLKGMWECMKNAGYLLPSSSQGLLPTKYCGDGTKGKKEYDDGEDTKVVGGLVIPGEDVQGNCLSSSSLYLTHNNILY